MRSAPGPTHPTSRPARHRPRPLPAPPTLTSSPASRRGPGPAHTGGGMQRLRGVGALGGSELVPRPPGVHTGRQPGEGRGFVALVGGASMWAWLPFPALLTNDVTSHPHPQSSRPWNTTVSVGAGHPRVGRRGHQHHDVTSWPCPQLFATEQRIPHPGPSLSVRVRARSADGWKVSGWSPTLTLGEPRLPFRCPSSLQHLRLHTSPSHPYGITSNLGAPPTSLIAPLPVCHGHPSR